jgi:CheY-like chemotaxis protein
MRQLRILLVEDDAVVGLLLAELLVGIGHDVCRIATTENEAILAATRERPDLMLVDAQLRQGSGIAAMKAILRRGPMPHVFMTGNSRLTMPANALVLRKPFGLTDLIAVLDGVAA